MDDEYIDGANCKCRDKYVQLIAYVQVSLGEVKDKVGSNFKICWSPCMKVKRD